MDEKAWTGGADNRYAEQRARGFLWLRFKADLETEYRLARDNNLALRIGLALVVAFTTALALLVLGRTLNHDTPRDWILVYSAVVNGAVAFYLLAYASRQRWLLRSELREQSVRDALTGLMNRRAFGPHVESAWLQAQRSLTSVGLMLLDIDDFKTINDKCGQPFGDNALQHVGQVLRRSAMRPMDAAARYGGDEFIAVWFEVDGGWLAKLAEDMPARLGVLKSVQPGENVNVTVSGGAVLAWPRPGMTVLDAIKAADEMMRETKKNARGTVGYKVLRPVAMPSASEKTAA